MLDTEISQFKSSTLLYFFHVKLINKILQCESKKSVIYGAWCKIVPFCATLLYGVFKYLLKFFFGTLMLKKSANPSFSLKIKSLEKQKCVYKLFLSKSKFYKDWITESQKIGQIVIRNLQFSVPGLIFKENLFELSS